MIIQLLNNCLAAYVLLLLVCVALSGQVLLLRVVSLTLVAAIVAGAYGAKEALISTGWYNPVLALFFGAVTGGAVAAIGTLPDMWFAAKGRVLGLLASLGFLKVMQGMITASTGGGVEVMPVAFSSLLPRGTFLSTPGWLIPGLVVCAFSVVVTVLLLYRTRLGNSAKAVGDNRILSTLFGVPALRIGLCVQVLGGGLAGLGGVFLAVDSGLRPDLGLATALKAFGVLVACRGGFGRLLLWAFAVVLLEQMSGYFWGGQIREAAGLTFLVVALLVQGGLQYRSVGSGRPAT